MVRVRGGVRSMSQSCSTRRVRVSVRVRVGVRSMSQACSTRRVRVRVRSMP